MRVDRSGVHCYPTMGDIHSPISQSDQYRIYT